MNTSSDPFEEAFFEYVNGITDTELIVHNNKGDDEIMPVHYFFRKADELPEQEQLALQHCRGRILDIGAGSGCHSLILQERGFDVTGLDIRPGFVEVMKKMGLRQTVLSDIFNYKDQTFDTLIMMMNGIGFCIDFSGLQKFLKHAKTLLNPGGQILLDSSDLLYLYRDDDDSVVLNLNEDYYGEVEYQVAYKGKKGIPFKWLFVDYSNLEFYANEAGFDCEMLFEDENFNYLARLS